MESQRLREAYLLAQEHPNKPEGELYHVQLGCGLYLDDYVINEDAELYRISTKRLIRGALSKGSNYTNVNLYVPDGDRGSKRRTYKLHCLMATTFLQKYDPTIHHVHHENTVVDQDGKLDNSVSNLSIETAQYNSINTHRHRARRFAALASGLIMPFVLLLYTLSPSPELRGIQIHEYVEETFVSKTNFQKRIRFSDIEWLSKHTEEEIAHYLSKVGHEVTAEDIKDWLEAHEVSRPISRLETPSVPPQRTSNKRFRYTYNDPLIPL